MLGSLGLETDELVAVNDAVGGWPTVDSVGAVDMSEVVVFETSRLPATGEMVVEISSDRVSSDGVASVYCSSML